MPIPLKLTFSTMISFDQALLLLSRCPAVLVDVGAGPTIASLKLFAGNLIELHVFDPVSVLYFRREHNERVSLHPHDSLLQLIEQPQDTLPKDDEPIDITLLEPSQNCDPDNITETTLLLIDKLNKCSDPETGEVRWALIAWDDLFLSHVQPSQLNYNFLNPFEKTKDKVEEFFRQRSQHQA